MFGLLLAAATAPLYAQSAEHPEIQRAITAYNEGRLDDALDLLSAAPPTLPARDQAVRYLYEGLIRLAAGDAERARASFHRAVGLDPTVRLDPAVHSPGRLQVFEEVRDEVVAQWRRFAEEAESRSDTLEARRLWVNVLDALPGDAEAEAGIARLSTRPPPGRVAEPVAEADSVVVPAGPVRPARRYSPGQAMVLGLVVPGMGEIYAGRTVRGLLVLGAAAGAAATGLLVERVAIDCLIVPVDDFCPADQIANERTERPYRTAGFGAAAAITLLGAIDAYFGARSQNERAAGAGARLEVPALRLGLADVRLELLRLRF